MQNYAEYGVKQWSGLQLGAEGMKKGGGERFFFRQHRALRLAQFVIDSLRAQELHQSQRPIRVLEQMRIK